MTNDRRALMLAAVAAVLVAHAFTGGWVGLALTLAITVVATATVIVALHRNAPEHRLAWYTLAASIPCFGFATTAARLAAMAGRDFSAPTLLLHAVAITLFLAGELQLIRLRRGGATLVDQLDIVAFVPAAGIALWRVVWAPFLPEDTAGLFFFLVLLALMVALGGRTIMSVRAALDRGMTTRSQVPTMLMLASLYPVMVAATASICGVVGGIEGVWFPGRWMNSAWPLTVVLFAAAVCHPAIGLSSSPVHEVEPPVDSQRLYIIGAALPIPLVVGLVTELGGPASRFVFSMGLLVNVAVIVRTAMAFSRTKRELDGRILAEAELQQQARFDTLSGLPNRALFTTRLEEAVERVRAGGGQLALLYIDLDRFKIVNDSFGPRAGDQVLVTVAERLRGAVRDQDTPARLSGDEFAVILESFDSVEDAHTIAERIREVLRDPIAVAGTSVVIGASIGLSVCDWQSQATDLVREADVALTDAKRRGRNTVAVFDASLRETIAQALQFEHELVGAADRGELRLFYQPQIELPTGAIVGVEALIRWQHPTQGLLGPGAFMDIAEDNGLIVPIGAWVIDEACRQHRRWQSALGTELVPCISVNVSPTQLMRDDVAERVHRALAATRLEPQQLHVEITEVALMGDPERAVAALDAIDAEGVQIAVDDFGTGYFSLSHLRRFPVHRIKIDRSFVRGIGVSSEDEAIIDATIDLAHALGLSVVAEGVETDEQLRYIERKGCDVVQGFLFAKPMPPDELAGFLRTWADRHGAPANPGPDRRRELAPITGPRARSLTTDAERSGRLPPPGPTP